MKMLVSSIMNLMLFNPSAIRLLYSNSAGNGLGTSDYFSVMEPGMREVNIMSSQLKKATLYIQIQILVLKNQN